MTTALLPVPVARREARTKTLGGALLAMGVTVFPLDQVEAFKGEYKKTELAKYMKMVRKAVFERVALAFLICSCCFIWSSLLKFGPETFSFILGACILVSLVLCSKAIKIYDKADQNVRTTRWHQTWMTPAEMLDAESGVPADVASLAARVEKRVPGAEFMVEKFKFDPFLIVTYKKERFCIAHWDLPFVER